MGARAHLSSRWVPDADRRPSFSFNEEQSTSMEYQKLSRYAVTEMISNEIRFESNKKSRSPFPRFLSTANLIIIFSIRKNYTRKFFSSFHETDSISGFFLRFRNIELDFHSTNLLRNEWRETIALWRHGKRKRM